MPPPKSSQATISSYFLPSPTKPAKRRERPTSPASPIDLTSDAENGIDDYADEPPIKKIKVARPSQSQPRSSFSTKSKKPSGTVTCTQSTLFPEVSAPPRSNFPTQTRSTGMAGRWAFMPQGSLPEGSGPEIGPTQDTSSGSDASREAEKAKRHEAFKKKLLTDDTRFRLRPGILGAPGTPHVEEGAQSSMPASEEGDAVEESGDDSDNTFREVMNMFSHPGSETAKGKGKQKASAKTTPTVRGSKQDSAAVTRRSKKPPPNVGPSGETYTPLELQVLTPGSSLPLRYSSSSQVLKLKEDNPGTLLMIEVGYRYKFFGNDAKVCKSCLVLGGMVDKEQVAAKELGMVAYNDRNFLVASIPTERLSVHLKKSVPVVIRIKTLFNVVNCYRLLARGYRVGVVNQAETAALKKVSENRNAPFDRKLTHLYTAATYV